MYHLEGSPSLAIHGASGGILVAPSAVARTWPHFAVYPEPDKVTRQYTFCGPGGRFYVYDWKMTSMYCGSGVQEYDQDCFSIEPNEEEFWSYRHPVGLCMYGAEKYRTQFECWFYSELRLTPFESKEMIKCACVSDHSDLHWAIMAVKPTLKDEDIQRLVRMYSRRA
jgi:hypothetical protein